MDGLNLLDQLMCFRVGWETETYAKSAISKLIWEARRTNSGESNLNNLITAITTQGGTETGCVVISRPKGSDGKFESPLNEYPHVLYAKIWRWPDARKNELKCRENCTHGIDALKSFVCVNPYHYDRIVSVSDSIKPTSTSNGVQSQAVTGTNAETVSLENVNEKQCWKTPSSTLSQTLPKDVYSLSCFQSANVAPPSLTASAVLGGSSFDNSSNSSTLTSELTGPSSNQYQAESSGTGLASGPNPEVELTSGATFVAMSLEDQLDPALHSPSNVHDVPPSIVDPLLAKYDSNDANTARRSNTSSISLSSDDGFELVYHDMDTSKLTDGATSEAGSVSGLTTAERIESEPTSGEVTIKPKPDMTPLINAAQDAFHGVELPIFSNHFIAELGNEIPLPESLNENVMDGAGCNKPMENINVQASENNVVCDRAVEMETENEESSQATGVEDVGDWKDKYEKLKNDYKKLKAAFVEVGFATTGSTLEMRCKEVQKVMNDVQDQFSSESESSAQYDRLKMFIDGGSCASTGGYSYGEGGFFGSGSATSATCSSSSSSTSTPYRRKYKPNLVFSTRKKNLTSPAATSNTIGVGAGATSTKTNPASQLDFGNSSKPFDSNAFEFLKQPSTRRKTRWDLCEPVPTVTIEHRPGPRPSQVQEQPKPHEVNNQFYNQVFSEDAGNVPKMDDELIALRNQVKSLETQLEVQRKDEVEKMMLYTNSMRDQYIKTVNRLSELNKALSDQVAEKDALIVTLNRTFEGLEISSLLDEKDREIDALNDHLLALSAILTANEEEIQSLKNEKRNLKRNSDTEETAQEISSKRRPDSQGKADEIENPLTPQHIFDHLCAELEKSNVEITPVNLPPTGVPTKENTPQNDVSGVQTKQDTPPNDVSSKDDLPKSPESQQIDTLTTSLELCQIKEKEQAMTAKLTEMVAELEVMKITHDKTKSDLEARLKNGAKQYAKLYVKYDKLVKNSQSTE